MRIGLINAFALPEFVSGATIQVHDLAVGLRHRGHEVAILSGARRANAAPLDVTRHRHRGIEITSLNTEPFIDFSDPLNYDNVDAANLVRGWVAHFKPDLLHAHSLQGIGAAWIDADLGVPVVVTMHDSWWVCARQFLVRSDLTFDGPLADFCGCDCSGGTDFNQGRRRWLAHRLEHASAIVVPSQRHADLMAIDGFDPAQITVSSNGLGLSHLPHIEDATSAPKRSGGPPHLGFVGQWHELKGLPLLLAARRLLRDDPLPFRLSCWGADSSSEGKRLPLGVELLGPYPPEQTRRVMSSLDALAIPSIAPESFSLVAREALNCGVPVICSDIGGQTEVVRDGVNGLLIETGSVSAWAGTLDRWGRDADLRGRLREGARTGAPGITVGQQLDRLEEIYRSAIEATDRPLRPAVVGVGPGAITVPEDIGAAGRGHAARTRLPGAPPPMLIVAGIGGATLRYGAYHLAQAHRSLGGSATVVDHRHPDIPDLLTPRGIVVFYRVPWSRWIARCIEAAREAGATVMFEVDDLIFDPGLRDRIPALLSLPPADAELWLEDTMRYQMTARACDLVLATTPEIARAARSLGMRSEVHYYGLGQETALMSQVALRLSQERRAARLRGGVFRIGYLTGTNTHDEDWAMVEPAVAATLERHPAAELWLVGPLRTQADDHPRVKRIPFRPLQELAALHTELDVVLAPQLPGLEFSEAKSAVKWVEAGAVGVPLIASPAGAFREFIEDGVTGLLAESDGWETALERFAADPDFRLRVGRAAREAIYRDHGPWARARAWRDTLDRVLQASHVGSAALPSGGPQRPPTPAEIEPEPPSGYADYTSGGAEATTDLAGTTSEAHLLIGGRGLHRIDVYTTNFGRPPRWPIKLKLCSDRGETLREGQLSPAEIADDGWSAWRFDPLDGRPGGVRLQLTQPSATRGQGAGVWNSLQAGTRFVEGRAVRGAMHLRCWSSPSREEICATALAIDLTTLSAVPGVELRTWRRLYYKGLHSIRSRGVAETAARTLAYGRRWQRGRRRRRG